MGCSPGSKSEWQVKVLSIFWSLVNSRLLENNRLFPGILASWGQKQPWPSIAVGILARKKGFKKMRQQKSQIHPKIFWFYLREEPEDRDMFLGFNVCPLAFRVWRNLEKPPTTLCHHNKESKDKLHTNATISTFCQTFKKTLESEDQIA